jgi:hypothetical protein
MEKVPFASVFNLISRNLDRTIRVRKEVTRKTLFPSYSVDRPPLVQWNRIPDVLSGDIEFLARGVSPMH